MEKEKGKREWHRPKDLYDVDGKGEVDIAGATSFATSVNNGYLRLTSLWRARAASLIALPAATAPPMPPATSRRPRVCPLDRWRLSAWLVSVNSIIRLEL